MNCSVMCASLRALRLGRSNLVSNGSECANLCAPVMILADLFCMTSSLFSCVVEARSSIAEQYSRLDLISAT